MRAHYTFFFGVLSLSTCAPRLEDRGGGTANPRGIIATGTCIKKISQDRGTVTLTTTVLAPTATESSQAATKESEKLRAALVALNLENATIDSTGFSVYEERDYHDKKTISRGFRTRIGLSIETSNIARLGEAIAAAAKLGVKEVDNLSTFVSPQKMKAEYESCLEVATGNARDKADKLAKGAGVKLGKVLMIEEGNRQQAASDYTRYAKSMNVMAMAAAPEADAPAPTVTSKSEDLTVSANVRFAVD